MSGQLRVAIVYDRVFPASHGGAERWFNLLSSALVSHGIDVTILTTDHWSPRSPPRIPGVEIIALCDAGAMWSGSQRSLGAAARFGRAVLGHLARHGAAYDVIHTSAMAPAAALACMLAGRARQLPVVIDWWEVWTRETWQAYLGRRRGAAAARLLQVLAMSPHTPLVYSLLHQRRLYSLRGRHDATLLQGVLADGVTFMPLAPAEPYLLLVNRLIPEKQTAALLPALALAKMRIPDLRAVIIGEGPEGSALAAEIAQAGLQDAVTILHRVSDDELHMVMQRALCLVLLSRREGYGLAIVEAMRFGTPALVLDHPDSAASERIVPGENGYVLVSLTPEVMASAILSVHEAGIDLRNRTLAWRLRHDRELSIAASLPRLLEIYRQGHSEGSIARWRNRRP